jgi:hypothetical protein
MEDGVGDQVGALRTMGYHHVLGGNMDGGATYYDGDYAPGPGGTYPGFRIDVPGIPIYCVTCHVDHDQFNGNQAFNLRRGSTPTPTNTDYDPTAPNHGLCISCHGLPMPKDQVDRKSAANTPGADPGLVAQPVTPSRYVASSHQYEVFSTYGDGSQFRANCVKCHNDELDKQFQTSEYTFGMHATNARRVLAALGRPTPVSDSPFKEEDFCYRCHSIAGSTPAGDGMKSTANRDWYGTSGAVMGTASQNIFRQMNLTGSGHRVANYNGIHRTSVFDEPIGFFATLGNKHVECTDCHSAHGAGSTTHTIGTNTIPASGGVLSDVVGVTYASGAMNTSNWDPTAATKPRGLGTFGTSLTTATREYEICMRCHSSVNPNVWSWGTTWTDISLEFNTGNRSYHPVFGSLNSGSSSALRANQLYTAATVANGPPDAMVFANPGTQTMYCSDCHGAMASDPAAMGPHGSTAPRVLKGRYPNRSNGTPYTLNEVAAGTATDLLCLKCHPMRSGNSWLHNGHDGANGHKTVTCTVCHLARPHGGKVSRLQVDHSTPRNTTTPNATPAPYRGASAGMAEFVKRPAGDYTQNDCSTGGSCGTSRHTASAARGTIENW